MKQIARATIPLALLLAWPLSCAAELDVAAESADRAGGLMGAAAAH